MTSTVVIGTAGHIDHGKSALVRALTGTDPDRLKEEQARGITIDLGFAHYQHDDGTVFSFVDVPGHERFVKNMLAGISGIHVVMLVIAADESVMPQSREHFDICRLLHVTGGIVALTKADLVDEETLELARLEARELVAGSFLAEAPIVPVSAKTGLGLDALRGALGELAKTRSGDSTSTAVRLPIDRAFSIKGFGTVVTGTLTSGRIAAETDLELLPVGRRIKARGVQVHGERQAVAAAGQRVAVNLGGVDLNEVARGDSLVTPGCFEPSRRFDAVVELLPSARPLRHGARIRFHHGTCEILGRVAVSSPSAVPTGATASADAGLTGRVEVRPGQRAYVRLRLEKPAVLTRGDRYILRAYSPPITIAGGLVLDPRPPRSGVRSATAQRRFERLDPERRPGRDATALESALGVMLEEAGASGLDLRTLTTRARVSPDAVEATVAGLVERARAVRLGGTLVVPAVLAHATARLLEDLRAYHRSQPLSEGLPREEARERLFGRAHPVVFERVLADLVADRQITARDRLALAEHQVSLSGDEARARDAIEQAYRVAGLRPPDLATLHTSTGIRSDVAGRITNLLLRQKVLVKVNALLFHASALQRLKEEIRALKHTAEGDVRIDVGTFKKRYDITRKFAIPLLEYLDRERITRRVGESRIVLA